MKERNANYINNNGEHFFCLVDSKDKNVLFETNCKVEIINALKKT